MVSGANNPHFLSDGTPGEFHFIDAAVFVYPHLQPLAQGIDHTGTHAMQTAGNLVAAAAEFAAGMKHGVNNFQSRTTGLGLDVHRDAASVIGDGDGVPGVNGNGDVLAVPGQCFVNGIVHNFIDQMMQTGRGGGADIHTGALAHRLQAFQHLNLLCTVFLCNFFF